MLNRLLVQQMAMLICLPVQAAMHTCLSTNAGSNAQLFTGAADGNACLSTNAGSDAQPSTSAADCKARPSTSAADGYARLSTNAGSNAQPSTSAAEGQLPESEAPAFLLVHGFGAFGEQWRGQIKALTAAGYQVCVHQILHLEISIILYMFLNCVHANMRYSFKLPIFEAVRYATKNDKKEQQKTITFVA